MKNFMMQSVGFVAIMTAIVSAIGGGALWYWHTDVSAFVFIAIPFVQSFIVGFYSALRVRSLWQSWGWGFLSIMISCMCYVAFAIEGFICVLMLVPFIALFTSVGSCAGHVTYKYRERRLQSATIAMVLAFGLGYYHATDPSEDMHTVSSAIDINATRMEVWNNIHQVSTLPQPSALPFIMGIAYPTHVVTTGNGVGAVRRCSFSTGTFIERITLWQPGVRLEFDVDSMPAPMQELTPYASVDPPHLHDYFVSTKGRFILDSLGPNLTRVTGTTWYYHKVKPTSYWSIWSDWLVHMIHMRVFNHIKHETEAIHHL